MFTPFDLNFYQSQCVALKYNYDEIIPGPAAQNWSELYNELDYTFDGSDDFKEKRRLINDRFNTYQDGLSSKRVFREIADALGNIPTEPYK